MYDNEDEVRTFLLDGLQLPDAVRGRVGVLQKSGAGFKLVCEIKRGSLGHIQGNEVKLKSIQVQRPHICRVQICSACNFLGLQHRCQRHLKQTVHSRAYMLQERYSLN